MQTRKSNNVTTTITCAAVLLWSCMAQAQFFTQSLLPEALTHKYVGGYWGGGISLADFDGDGIDDVTLCQNGSAPLFIKGGIDVFESASMPWSTIGEIKQLTWVDFDNDGDRDLSLTGLEMPVHLFQRVGPDLLVPLDALSGISADSVQSYGHAWGDYDLDGDLDLFVCTYDPTSADFVNSDNQLYRNEGNAHFTDVTAAAGFQSMVNYTFVSLWMDYNNDLYPDLLVINDRYEVPNYLYHNNGDGTFTDVSVAANLDDYIFGMTATADDFDNDGDLDIYITNGVGGNLHKLNNGDGTFTDAAEALGTQLNLFCWSAQFIDADRDGQQDLHVCSTPHINLIGENQLLMNEEQGFVSGLMESGMLGDEGWSRSSAIGDFNGDGLADMGICKSGPSISTFWTALPNGNNWMKINLEGTVSNHDGVSSWIHCYADSMVYTRYTYCGEGYLAQNSFSEFFGLGTTNMLDSITVRWPSGIIDTWFNVPSNQQLHLVEGESQRVELASGHNFQICINASEWIESNTWNSYAWSTGDTIRHISLTEPSRIWLDAYDAWGNHFVSDTIVLSITDPLVATVQTLDVSCHGNFDGEAFVFAEFATNNYVLNNDTNQTGHFLAIGAGSYEVWITDEMGCEASFTFEISQPDLFAMNAEVHDALCNGGQDGWIEVNFFGGTPPYAWLENPQLDGLAAGSYSLTSFDNHGCVSEVIAVIAEPDPLILTWESFPEWDGMSNGAIHASGTGGTLPYEFSLDSVASDSASWLGLSAGDYTLQVIDSNGCSAQTIGEVQSSSSVHEFLSSGCRLYPNPAGMRETIYLRSIDLIDHASILDTSGGVIWDSRINTKEFEIPSLCFNAGYYIVRLQKHGVVFSMPLVIAE